MQLLPDDLVTQIIIDSIKDEPVFHFLNLRNKICGTFRRICDFDEVLLHVSLRDLRRLCKNCYVQSCFERCFRNDNHPEALCFEGMERLMRRRNPDKGLKLIRDAAAEDSGAKYFLAMLNYRCNPVDLEAMALLQEISDVPSPLTGCGRTTTCGGCATSSSRISTTMRGKLQCSRNILGNYVRDVDIWTQIYYSFIETI
jgi:hypothetical protein